MRATLCLSALTVLAASSFAAKWDGLGVHWDANIFKYPTMLPRTAKQAEEQGFIKIGSGNCEDNGFKGFAWAPPTPEALLTNYDVSTTLLFDVNGYIAGIQAGILYREGKANNYPSNIQMMKPFKQISDPEDLFIVSAYFTDPSKICTTGRTKEEFDRDGTGTALYIQNGDEIMEIPKKQKNLQRPWVEGKCFVTMGKHYWYDISADMSCDAMFPVFLLYNKGELNGFGWAFTADLSGDNYEHPAFNVFGLFQKEVPKCLKNYETISTMHVYMNAHPSLNFC